MKEEKRTEAARQLFRNMMDYVIGNNEQRQTLIEFALGKLTPAQAEELAEIFFEEAKKKAPEIVGRLMAYQQQEGRGPTWKGYGIDLARVAVAKAMTDKGIDAMIAVQVEAELENMLKAAMKTAEEKVVKTVNTEVGKRVMDGFDAAYGRVRENLKKAFDG